MKQKRSSTSDLPTMLPLRDSLPANRLKKNPTLTGLQICLAPALLLYIRLPATSAPARKQSVYSMDMDSDSDLSDRPPVDLFVEKGELSDQDPDMTSTDQTLSEDQT